MKIPCSLRKKYQGPTFIRDKQNYLFRSLGYKMDSSSKQGGKCKSIQTRQLLLLSHKILQKVTFSG